MTKFWEISIAILLGVTANLLTPYIKGVFRHGTTGLRKMRAKVLEEEISDAHFYSKHPEWLILFILKQFARLFGVAIVMISVALYASLSFFEVRFVLGMMPGVLIFVVTELYDIVQAYKHARHFTEFETQTRKKIARLTGKSPDAIESSSNNPPSPS